MSFRVGWPAVFLALRFFQDIEKALLKFRQGGVVEGECAIGLEVEGVLGKIRGRGPQGAGVAVFVQADNELVMADAAGTSAGRGHRRRIQPGGAKRVLAFFRGVVAGPGVVDDMDFNAPVLGGPKGSGDFIQKEFIDGNMQGFVLLGP